MVADNGEPKNTFRDEVAKEVVSEMAMVERDQRATYLFLKHQDDMFTDDRIHFTVALEKVKQFGIAIFKLPDCVSRTDMLTQNKGHIEQLEKQVANSHLPRAQEIILALLEESFGEEDMVVDKVTSEDE
jgi:recombinational DNA repair protein RecR